MTSLEISAPATISVLGGEPALTSCNALPPGGISVSGAGTGTVSVVVTAANAQAGLSASGAAGATISSSGATLAITGTALQVNAALASLEITEPAALANDTLAITAAAPGFSPAQTGIAVDILPDAGPAFVAPPLIVTVQPDALDALGFLDFSDPIASSLAETGLGRGETLSLTLAVSSGLLLLDGYTGASPVSAVGIGTGEIILTFTADDIGAANTLLTGLKFDGPSVTGGEHLNYALWNYTGVLPRVVTSGNVFLNIAGTPGIPGLDVIGNQSVLNGSSTFSSATLIAGTLAVDGNLTAPEGVVINPTGNLELPENYLFLSGTSLNFGTMNAAGIALSGALVDAGAAASAGPLLLQPNAELDFSGQFSGDAAERFAFDQAILLSAGAVLTGSGTLEAGNFSESGVISGPGVIEVLDNETLLISAGEISGGAQLQAAGGGVMILGPIAPLYGVFNATPLTIDNSVTLSFLAPPAVLPITGGYASTLGGAGGAFVITGPQVFAGTVNGFAAGDALIFPDLTNFNILNAPAGTIIAAGQDSSGATDTYTFAATVAPGTQLATGLDAEGDPEIFDRPAAVTLSQADVFEATAHIPQPLPGLLLQIEPHNGSITSLVLTLSVAHGTLEDGGSGAAARITLSAPSVSALNASLAGLTYTGNGSVDTLAIASATGLLAGLSDVFSIGPANPGSVNPYSGAAVSEGETAVFPAGSQLTEMQPVDAGVLLVQSTTEFFSEVDAQGLSGTALEVDSGADAIFAAPSEALFGADVTLGDVNGPGTLVVVTDDFVANGNLTIAANPGGGGSELDILGSMSVAGSLDDGAEGNAALVLSGTLSANNLQLASSGVFQALGQASASIGFIYDTGTVALGGDAQVSVGSLTSTRLFALGGTASLAVTGEFLENAGFGSIGQDSELSAGAAVLFGGATLDLAGTLAAQASLVGAGALNLQGGTIVTPDLVLGGTLAGYGILDTGTIAGGGVLVAEGGVLYAGGSLGTSVAPTIESGGVLDLSQPFQGSQIFFGGGDALLNLGELGAFGAAAADFAASDAIDVQGVAPSLVSYSGGTLGTVEVRDSVGGTISVFSLEIAAGQPAVSIVSDGAHGALITLGGELPCFARGTGLLTPHGYRPVETLKPGDPLITASGISRPVRWIGRRTLDLGPEAARAARPVLILPNAFGPGLPARKLRLSPLHCVFVDGVLVPVLHLVNGATILREAHVAAMTYFHIELDRHDVLLAEGLPCESYFDSGNRSGLYVELGRRCPAAKPFAPSVMKGARLAKIRRRLHEIALQAGFRLTYWPGLRAAAEGQGVVPEIRRLGRWRVARFLFEAPVREMTLISATATPADTDPESEDRREVGICLRKPGFARLGAGFYPRAAQDDGHWAGPVAGLRLDAPAREVSLPLAAIVQSWRIDGTPPSG